MFIQSNPKETGFMQYFFSFGLLENKVKVMKKWKFSLNGTCCALDILHET